MNYSRMTWSLTLVASMLGLGWTVFGLYDMRFPQVHAPILVSILATAMLLGLAYRYTRISTGLATVLAGVLLALFTGTTWQWLVVVWFGIASQLLGQWLLQKIGIHAAEEQSQLLLGAGILGTLVGLMAHFPIASAGTYGLLIALPLVLGAGSLRKVGAALKNTSLFRKDATLSPLALTLDCLLGGTTLLYLSFALAPEVGHDALAMHLFIPGYLQAHGRWSFDASTYVWAVMPMLGDWIYAVPYLLAGESAARLTNVAFILVLAWLIRDLTLWAGGTPMGARWAILIFLTTPLTFTEGSSLFIESVWSCLVMAGVFAVLKVCFDKQLSGQRLLLGGSLLGLSLAAKAVTLPLLPLVLLLLLWKRKHWFNSGSDYWHWSLGVLLFGALGAVPYVTAWWLTGNPIFPFFNAIFKSPLWELVNFDATAFGKGVPWDVLYAITFDSGRFLEGKAGAGGFQWLLLFLPLGLSLLGNRHMKAATMMFFSVAAVFLVFRSTAYLRYIFPVYAILASVIGVGFSSAETWPRNAKIWLGALGFFTVFLGTTFLTSGAFYHTSALQSLKGTSAREQYLESRLPIRNAIPLVNALNTGQRPVAVLSEPFGAGLNAEALYASWYNLSMQTPYFAAKTETDLVKLLIDKNVEFLIVDKGWNAYGNVSPDQLALVPRVAELVWSQGPVSVYKLKASHRHQTEYLRSPNFENIADWTLADPAMYDPATQSVHVTVANAATQTIQVVAGHDYVNTVRARCLHEKTQGRIQVNWSNAQGNFMQTRIDVFDCTPEWKDYSMTFTAPSGAVTATVFASGHTSVPLAFNSMSFK